MGQTTVLIIDHSLPKEHGRAFHEICTKSTRSGVQLNCEQVIHSEEDPEHVCNEIKARGHVNLIFLVVTPEGFERSQLMIGMIRDTLSTIPVIVLADGLCQEDITALLKRGATDFVIPPLNVIDIASRVIRLIEHSRHKKSTTNALKKKLGLLRIVGNHPVFLEEINKIPQVARCDANVVITGETGTGKELFSRSIHYLSARSGMPFVPVNCGAIPKELVENELFGHAKGSYTGASSPHPGLIQEAKGGTLFLDEIDSLPLASQVKILRFLQEKEFRPIGSSRIQRADVRVIAAANVDLEQAMNDGLLRHDLFYRLNIISIKIPPLREHKNDIPLLAKHFLKKHAVAHNSNITGIEPDALRKLVLYEWPGNIRELENCIERAVIFSKHRLIQTSDIALPEAQSAAFFEPFHVVKSRVIAKFEKDYIQSLLLANCGNITRAANTAQKNRRAFWELIRKHEIDVQRYKAGQT